MEIVRNQSCLKHNEQVNFMCTWSDCFKDKNIMVCKSCFKDHASHSSHMIELNLLNMKVLNLMKKRMDYEEKYDNACDEMIKELKVFKSFKEEVVSRLNMRERELNEICKKIRRHIRYEKDDQLFKCNFGQIYLSMRARNENMELYRVFRKHINDLEAQLHQSLLRFKIQVKDQVFLLSRKDYQICELVKPIPEKQLTPPISYCEPNVRGFKKETIKFKFKDEFSPNLIRIGDDEFMTYNMKHEIVRLYNTKNLLFPRLMLFGSPVQNMVMMGKNAFCSLEGGGVKIFDMLTERVLKDFASSNQKSAKVSDLMAVSGNSIFSFIMSPNQIVNFRFNDVRETLQIIKGIETKFKVSKSLLMDQQFYTVCDDFRVRGFSQQNIQQIYNLKFSAPIKTVCRFNSQSILVGGQMNTISLLDLRSKRVVNEPKISSFCHELDKITDNCFLYTWGRSVMMMDMRMLKIVLTAEADGSEIHRIRSINSNLFVTSSNALHIWHLVN